MALTPPDISGSIATCGDCCSAGKDCSAEWSVFLVYFFNYNYMAYICLAVINRLMKSQAFKSVGKPSKEIPRPQKITNLQHDMGLADNKKLYSHCRVSLFFLLSFHLDLLLMTGNHSRCPGMC